MKTFVRQPNGFFHYTPPNYPPSTTENDGTNIGRYDVRRTMAIVNPDRKWLNSYYFLFFVTATDGNKYHLCIDPILIGPNTLTAFCSFTDFSDPTYPKVRTGSKTEPATAGTEVLNVRSASHNLTSPAGGDNYSTLHLESYFSGVSADLVARPRGKNMYYGGVGGIVTPGHGDDFTTVPPGWSWYWANPHLELSGTITVDGNPITIDTERSWGMLERQYGAFNVSSKGFYLVWAYLSNGMVVQIWVISPHRDGTGESSMVTVWHPDGLHEVAGVDMSVTRAWDTWTSNVTGRVYFNKYQIALTAHRAVFTFEVPIRSPEVTPVPGETGTTVSESYCEGTVEWDGEKMAWLGHCEQMSLHYETVDGKI